MYNVIIYNNVLILLSGSAVYFDYALMYVYIYYLDFDPLKIHYFHKLMSVYKKVCKEDTFMQCLMCISDEKKIVH